MKKYRIVETRPATETWVYEVEAQSEQDALKLITEGDATDDIVDYSVETEYCQDAEYTIAED